MRNMPLLPTILLIEDNRSIADALTQTLQSSYDIDIAATGRLALYKTDIRAYSIIVLDLNLPDMPGIIICQQLRDRGVSTPILILSAENNVLTKINLLDMGANDYLTKPFSLGELKARLRALIRTNHPTGHLPEQLVIGGVLLNRQTHQVSREGVAITLRRKEFALLECLMEHAGSVVSRDVLIRSAWYDTSDFWTNTVDVHIKYLRDKLDRPFDTALIQTVYGLGYRFAVTRPLDTAAAKVLETV